MPDVIDLLVELVRIDSVNPALDPAGAGETRLAQFVRDWCQARGLDVRWVEPLPGRPSLVARAPGTGGGRSLMHYAHFDDNLSDLKQRIAERIVSS